MNQMEKWKLNISNSDKKEIIKINLTKLNCFQIIFLKKTNIYANANENEKNFIKIINKIYLFELIVSRKLKIHFLTFIFKIRKILKQSKLNFLIQNHFLVQDH